MSGQYSAPRYYEIAFDMNRRQEVNFLVHCFRRYARRPVKTVLDIACGTGPHLIRLAERQAFTLAGLGSPCTVDDFADHRTERTEPITARYRGTTVATHPPNSSGVVGLESFQLGGVSLEHRSV